MAVPPAAPRLLLIAPATAAAEVSARARLLQMLSTSHVASRLRRLGCRRSG